MTFHNHANCIARGNTRAICRMPGHLAVVCTNDVVPTEVDSSNLVLLRRLEDKLAVQVD